MTKILYTADATVTGGRVEGHGTTSDGALDVRLSPPGQDGGTNPEQLFAVGYAACFESAVRVVGRRRKLGVDDVSVAARVHLKAAEDRSFALGVELDVALPALGDDEAVEVVRAAHGVCPYSNATRGNIDVAITANGRAI